MNTYDRPRALGFAAGLLAGAGVLLMHGTAAAQQNTPPIRIDANREGWTDAGIALAQGDTLTLSPSGAAGWEPGIEHDSSGAGASSCTLAITEAPVGALLARVGTNAPVVVREATTLSGPGPVSFIYNDCPGKYFDNVGGFIVSATLKVAGSAAPVSAPPVSAVAATAPAAPTMQAAPVPQPTPLPTAEVAKAKDGWGVWPLAWALIIAGAGYGLVRFRKRLRVALPALLPRRIGTPFPESARLESSAWLAPVRLRFVQEDTRHTELTIGGPDQDIDFGLNTTLATLVPREDGTVRLNVNPSAGRVMVDGVAVILGQRLVDGSRVHMGAREFVFRIDSATQSGGRHGSVDMLDKVDPRAAAIAESADRRSA